MGKRDFTPLRVHDAAALFMQVKGAQGLRAQPPWLSIMNDVPPSEPMVRTQPVQHNPPRRFGKIRKASRMFQPQQIRHEEDDLRREFFGDHPWELARPRVLLENDGKDYQRWDWSKPDQTGRPLSGESVVQRQMYLMGRMKFSKAKAYDQARKEFYELRHVEEVEQRVAREEALSTGATFGKSALEVGMELENKTFEQWKEWAQVQVTLQEQTRSAAYTGLGSQSSVEDLDDSSSGMDAVLDELEPDTVPNTNPV